MHLLSFQPINKGRIFSVEKVYQKYSEREREKERERERERED
jgi:hypothetical protein